MSLAKLQSLKDANEPLVITTIEYQAICNEVLEMPVESRLQYDDLILNFKFNGVDLIVEEPAHGANA